MDDVVAQSKAIIERGSKSFAAAAKLFDPATRERAYMLYAWCRYCDDRIDGQDLGFGQDSPSQEQQRAIVEELREKTRAALADEGGLEPVFEALRRVHQECRLDPQHPLELLQGFGMDASRRRYRTLDDLMLYCWHVAGVVGAMMARIMGVTSSEVTLRAVDLGLAFQLTNICRDVMEDAADGRIYLPETWLIEAGIPLAPEAFPGNEEKLALIARRLISEAEPYYHSARAGIAHLPWRSAWAISAALLVYRDIGNIVAARGESAWRERAGSGKLRKLWLLAAGAVLAARLKLRHPRAARPAHLWYPPKAVEP